MSINPFNDYASPSQAGIDAQWQANRNQAMRALVDQFAMAPAASALGGLSGDLRNAIPQEPPKPKGHAPLTFKPGIQNLAKNIRGWSDV